MKRRSTKAVWCIALLVAAGCSSGRMGSLGLRVEAGYFRPDLDATFRYDDAGIAGTPVNLAGVASLPRDGDAPYGAATVALGGFKLAMSGWQSSQSGLANATAAFTFGGSSFSAGVPLYTDLDMGNIAASAEYSILPFEMIHASIGLGIDLFDIDLRMREPTLSLDERLNKLAPVPVLAGTLEISPIELVTIFVQARGLYLSSSMVGGDTNIQGSSSFIDLWVGARLNWEFLTGTIGYKYINLDAAVVDVGAVDATYKGFVATVGVEF